MLDATIGHFGEITDLINNAAGNFLSFSEDLTPNGFRAVVEIVLFGSFYFSLHFGRYLIREKRKGNILNIVTTYAETGSAYVLPSACAKAGVLAMTRSLAYEWGRFGIRVNAIAPGIVPTRGAFERLIPDERAVEVIRKSIPLGRLGRPEEIADLAAFLLSDAAEYIQGECITMDGGERLIAGQFSRLDQLFEREELRRFFSALKQKSHSRKGS
jgi:NAD(P)-dependent dehydrogenase (short-subunit alcohol dehydrogenase family)